MLYSELSQYTHEQLSEFTHEQLTWLTQLGLITDRTRDDVLRWNELRNKGWSNMTEDERKEWMGEIDVSPSAARGMYTHIDINRVVRAMEAIVNRFREKGYTVPDMIHIEEFGYDFKFIYDDMVKYLRNVTSIRNLIPVYPTTPRVPYDKEPLNHARANDIEQILMDVDEIFTKLTQSWHYAGDLFTGEV